MFRTHWIWINGHSLVSDSTNGAPFPVNTWFSVRSSQHVVPSWMPLTTEGTYDWWTKKKNIEKHCFASCYAQIQPNLCSRPGTSWSVWVEVSVQSTGWVCYLTCAVQLLFNTSFQGISNFRVDLSKYEISNVLFSSVHLQQKNPVYEW